MPGNPTPDAKAYQRPDGCWFWLDGKDYAPPDTKEVDPEKLIKDPGSSFKGKTGEGTDRSDPREALKEARMGGSQGESGGGFNTVK
ncbi:hypothetical protein LTR08_005198 [Meristemomyces frigidus]|nr:hypothetical protein LTR08_005198 [Meristemomyces frigidus]